MAVALTAVPRPLREALADRYLLEHELGRGGMAVVYLARDLRHDRSVAVKVMQPELAAIVTTERFLQEIQIAARLSHPHIIPLYDSGTAGGVVYYVMQFVEGESLKQRLAREGRLSVKDALRIAREVADALDYAHRHGIVHRDVKPENILLNDGQAVVADFGIARAMGEAATEPLTMSGLIVGTAEYMSPEQVAGDREIDGRSDVYSLGCVLYAMLTGQPPFGGQTPQAVMASRLTKPVPSVREARPELPTTVELVVARTLATAPANRHQTARELSMAIEDALASFWRAGPEPTERRARGRRAVVVGTAVGLSALGVALVLYWLRAPRPPEVVSTTPLTWEPEMEFHPALSPSGKSVAYVAGPLRRSRARIWVRPIAGGRAIPLTDTTIRAPAWPVWAPGDDRIAFESEDGIFVVSASGGLPRRVAAKEGGARTPTWSPDGTRLAYASDSGILVLHVDSGVTREVVRALRPARPHWSRRGDRLAYDVSIPESVARRIGGRRAIGVVPLHGGTARTLTDSTSWNGNPVWMPDGRSLLFLSDRGSEGDIYWLALRRDGTARGSPARLTTGARVGSISLSADGTSLAYSSMRLGINVSSIAIDPRRVQSLVDAQSLAHGTQGDQGVFSMTFWPTGRAIAFESDPRGNRDIFRMSLDGGEPDRLTDSDADDIQPSWSPDGRRIAFISLRGGGRDVYVMDADGGDQRRVAVGSAETRYPDWSRPDGARIVFTAAHGLYVVARDSLGNFGPPHRLTASTGYMARWSPDGRRIAFVGAGGTIQLIAADGGAQRTLWSGPPGLAPPAGWNEFRGARVEWSRDGHTLFYRSVLGAGHWNLWAVPLSGAEPRILFRVADGRHFSGDMMATDGRRLYFGVGTEESDIRLATLRLR